LNRPQASPSLAAASRDGAPAALDLYISASARSNSAAIEVPELGYSEAPMLADICRVSRLIA
jgi:hypothetical protein